MLFGEVKVVGEVQGHKERLLSHLFCKHFCYSMSKGILSLKSLSGILKPDSLRNPCTDGKLQYHSVNSEDRGLAWCNYDGLFHSVFVRENRALWLLNK